MMETHDSYSVHVKGHDWTGGEAIEFAIPAQVRIDDGPDAARQQEIGAETVLLDERKAVPLHEIDEEIVIEKHIVPSFQERLLADARAQLVQRVVLLPTSLQH